MGWEPSKTVVYEYDGDRLVRSHVTSEAEWDLEQRSLMLALHLLEADLGPHGFRMSEATSPLVNAPGSTLGFRARPEPVIDEVEKMRAKARREYEKLHKDDEGALDGAIFLVDRITD